MNELHLFAGCGGGILGGIILGHQPICAVEIEPYCRRVLLQRQRDGALPRFPIWDDIKTFDGTPWRGRADVVCGGFPCQDISAAGKGAGITGERSGLWGEMARVVREVRPRFVFVENSPMLTIRGLGTVLRDLAAMGYDAKWGVLGARHACGNTHRDRAWIVARAEGERLAVSSIYEGKHYKGCAAKGTAFRPALTLLSEIGGRAFITVPESLRMDDGVAPRLDRLKALGNGQVPAVAALAWRTLIN